MELATIHFFFLFNCVCVFVCFGGEGGLWLFSFDVQVSLAVDLPQSCICRLIGQVCRSILPNQEEKHQLWSWDHTGLHIRTRLSVHFFKGNVSGFLFVSFFLVLFFSAFGHLESY